MIEFVVIPSSQNFHINIFTSNINGYRVTKKRVVLAFVNCTLRWKSVDRVLLLTLKHKASQNPCSEDIIKTLQLTLKMKWDFTPPLSPPCHGNKAHFKVRMVFLSQLLEMKAFSELRWPESTEWVRRSVQFLLFLWIAHRFYKLSADEQQSRWQKNVCGTFWIQAEQSPAALSRWIKATIFTQSSPESCVRGQIHSGPNHMILAINFGAFLG